MEPRPDPGVLPGLEPPPATHAGAAAQFLGQGLPRDPGPQHKEDPREDLPMIQGFATGIAVPPRLGRRQEGLDERPEPVVQERFGHASPPCPRKMAVEYTIEGPLASSHFVRRSKYYRGLKDKQGRNIQGGGFLYKTKLVFEKHGNTIGWALCFQIVAWIVILDFLGYKKSEEQLANEVSAFQINAPFYAHIPTMHIFQKTLILLSTGYVLLKRLVAILVSNGLMVAR